MSVRVAKTFSLFNSSATTENRTTAKDGINRIKHKIGATIELDVKQLGQVFTPAHIVSKMLSLRRNHGSVLEPSCGNGMFLSELESNAVGIEVDKALNQDKRVIACDFFSYQTTNKFDTIIGNPPYVRYQDIAPDTKSLLNMGLFDKRSNLYLFFIAKCVAHLRDGGELIFITPRDFIKATSSRKLNEMLYKTGAMTHYYEMGDASIFDGATPNCAIWRWVKGRKSRHMSTGGDFCYSNGQIWFGDDAKAHLGDYFDIKVGAVSGADNIFANARRGNVDMVCSTTAKDRRTRRVIYNKKDESLLPHKETLMSRRIRKFDENNWWEWGRRFCEREGERIYVNVKTRNTSPFFVSNVTAYDGSVMALFPKESMDLRKVAGRLNEVDWNKLGFVCDGRFLFTQRSLETARIDL